MRKLLGRERNELINKGAWSKEEDEKLVDYIRKHGKSCWGSIPQAAGLFRSGKSCRLRWVNYFRPDVKRGKFGDDVEELIIKLHVLLGNRWSLIAGRLPGRTDNEVKNFWNTHLKKKLIKMGLDPNKHRIGQALVRKYCTEATVSVSNYKSPNYSNCSSSTIEALSDCRSKGDSIFSLPDLNLDLTIKPPE